MLRIPGRSRRDGFTGETESVPRPSAVCGDADGHCVRAGADHYSVWAVPGLHDHDFEQHRSFECGSVGGFSWRRIFLHGAEFLLAEVLSGAFDAGRGAGREVYAGVRAVEARGWTGGKRTYDGR